MDDPLTSQECSDIGSLSSSADAPLRGRECCNPPHEMGRELRFAPEFCVDFTPSPLSHPDPTKYRYKSSMKGLSTGSATVEQVIQQTQQWDEAAVQSYIDNRVQKNIHLDYKACDTLQKTEGKKREVGKDVSSFANSDGGTIIYGVKEDCVFR